MEKMKFESANLLQENIAKLAQIFPSVVSERRVNDGSLQKAVNFSALRRLLAMELVDGDEAYEFRWVGKRDATVEAHKATRKTLRPCLEESKDENTTQNLYIEGDNLEVLKLLQECYLGKVKMIFIDPPYNTGNDFIYEDDFMMHREEWEERSGEVEFDENGGKIRLFRNTSQNGRFHSDWCSMIYSRLLLARNLLSDDGVIFISSDDNEQGNLGKICDEVFGEENFVFQISWRRTDNQSNIGKCAKVKDYILTFAKNLQKLQLGRLPLSEKAINEYRYKDEKGLFRRAILLDKTRGRYNYPVKTASGKILNGPWMKSEEEFKKLDAAGKIYL